MYTKLLMLNLQLNLFQRILSMFWALLPTNSLTTSDICSPKMVMVKQAKSQTVHAVGVVNAKCVKVSLGSVGEPRPGGL